MSFVTDAACTVTAPKHGSHGTTFWYAPTTVGNPDIHRILSGPFLTTNQCPWLDPM